VFFVAIAVDESRAKMPVGGMNETRHESGVWVRRYPGRNKTIEVAAALRRRPRIGRGLGKLLE
jgi:hypothetical protein